MKIIIIAIMFGIIALISKAYHKDNDNFPPGMAC